MRNILFVRLHPILCLLLALLVSGCATRIPNPPLTDDENGYFFRNHLPRHNSKSLFVVLAFSGGGTRSAAFSYGVLEKLRDTTILIDGRPRSLLDEVDVISSVSGGSYAAAYYGLYGRRIFRDFGERFLYRDIQQALATQVLNPANWPALAGAGYNRGDLAAHWLDEHLFDHATFTDMSKGELPYVILNASDLNNGMTFSFIQQQFDFLCSDINNYPVANAVLASSAVPVLFGPVTLVNHDTGCVQKQRLWDTWVGPSLQSDSILQRRYQVARALERYYDPKRMPLVRLVDGGVTDNLGIRGSMISPVAHYGHALEMRGAFSPADIKKIRRVLVIVANAQTYHDYPWSEHAEEPGIIDTLDAAFSASIGILNTETIGLAKHAFDMWANYINAARTAEQRVKVHFVTLTFNQIRDPERREYFNMIPTTLALERKDVDAIRKLAGQLLDESAHFQAFLRDVH